MDVQQQIAAQSVAEQRREFDVSNELMAPWRDQGQAALYNLSDLTGLPSPTSYTDASGKTVTRTPMNTTTALTSDPGYKVRLDALNQALMRGGMGAQNYGSGNFWDSVMKSNQDYASNEFGNVYNRLAGVAGTGQTAAQGTANAATLTGGNIAYTLGNLGRNMAGLGTDSSSMYQNFGSQGNNAMNNYLFWQMMGGGGATPGVT